MAGTEQPAIYCVHLTSSVDRRERMERRFRHHGLDRATLVPAIRVDLPRDSSDEWKAMAGRYATASHLRCMRRILEEVPEEEGGAIVVEDDILIHNEFLQRLPSVLANLPESAGALLLGFMVFGWPDRLVWSGRRPEEQNLVPVLWGETWGAHGYWIRHSYARELVDRLGDTPIEELSNVVEDQLTFPANGHAVYPPLMLQETVDSVVRPAHELDVHIAMQAAWPYRDYAAAEAEPPISPLAALPDPGRTIGAEVLGGGPQASWTARSVRALASHDPSEADYRLLIEGGMSVDWRGPLPVLDADLYRVDDSEGRFTAALVRRDSGLTVDLSRPQDISSTDEATVENLSALEVRPGFDLGDLLPNLQIAELWIDAHPDWPRSGPLLEVDPGGGLRAFVTVSEEPPGSRSADYLVRLGPDLELAGIELASDGDPEATALEPVPIGGGTSLRVEAAGAGMHRLSRLGEDGQADATSPSFWFTERSRERCSGLAIVGGGLVFGLSIDDRHAALAACDLEELLGLLVRQASDADDVRKRWQEG